MITTVKETTGTKQKRVLLHVVRRPMSAGFIPEKAVSGRDGLGEVGRVKGGKTHRQQMRRQMIWSSKC